jgi:RNA recognition motif-containing protein
MMSNKLYVGNLSYQVEESELKNVFSECGNVASVKIITDRDTGRSKGFGFVEMENSDEANACIDQLNGKEVDGRPIKVNAAMEKERPSGGRGGYNRGGGHGGGGRGRRDSYGNR